MTNAVEPDHVCIDRQRHDDLIAAFRTLGRLVHDDYPADRSLAEIVSTWGDEHARTHVDAIARLTAVYGETNSSRALSSNADK